MIRVFLEKWLFSEPWLLLVHKCRFYLKHYAISGQLNPPKSISWSKTSFLTLSCIDFATDPQLILQNYQAKSQYAMRCGSDRLNSIRCPKTLFSIGFFFRNNMLTLRNQLVIHDLYPLPNVEKHLLLSWYAISQVHPGFLTRRNGAKLSCVTIHISSFSRFGQNTYGSYRDYTLTKWQKPISMINQGSRFFLENLALSVSFISLSCNLMPSFGKTLLQEAS